MEIHDANKEDLPAIVRLLADDPLGTPRERFEDPLPAAYGEAFDQMQNQPGNVAVVAVEGGRVIGCLQLTLICGLSRMGMKRAQIEGVRVDKGQRGKGVGEGLMKFAINRARQMGCGLVQLTTDNARPDAHRFYERLGFAASHTGMKLGL